MTLREHRGQAASGPLRTRRRLVGCYRSRAAGAGVMDRGADRPVPDRGHLGPDSHDAAIGEDDPAARFRWVPPFPSARQRVAGVEGEPAARDERALQVGQGEPPLVVGDEELSTWLVITTTSNDLS